MYERIDNELAHIYLSRIDITSDSLTILWTLEPELSLAYDLVEILVHAEPQS